MKENHIQILGLLVTMLYFIAIVFLYWAEPKSLAEASSKAASTIESAVTKGEVLTGTYEVNKEDFDMGLRNFYENKFIAARDSFARADPEQRDPNTQFYIAYSYYRQGWGRISNDDALFRQALEANERVIALDPRFRSRDANLKLKSPAELKNELEEGLQTTADDFNPLRLVRERN